jgi:hypothetical protein
LKKTFLVITILFTVSVFIKLKYFNRPLSDQLEWCTAHTLINCKNWAAQGFAKNHFAPLYTFKGAANTYDEQVGFGSIMDAEGKTFYISYPAFSYILMYLILHFLHLPLTAFSVELMNMILHFISCFFLIAALKKIFKIENIFSPILLFCLAVYLFTYSQLWFLCNIYCNDTFSWYLLVVMIWWMTKIYDREKINFSIIFITFLLAFFLTLSEWVGLFFSVAAAFMFLLQKKFINKFWIITALSLGSAAALLLTVWQFSQIAGFENLILAMKNRYLYRSGLNGNVNSESNLGISNIHSWIEILKHYILAYGFIFVFVVLGIFYSLIKNKISKNNNEFVFVAGCLSSAILLHHLAFWNFTAIHNFSVGISSCLIVILFGVIIQNLNWANFSAIQNSWKNKIIFLIIVLALVCNVTVYFYKNRFNDEQPRYKNYGEWIKNNISPNSTIFIVRSKFLKIQFAQIDCYAERNYFIFESDTVCQNILKKQKNKTAVVLVEENNSLKIDHQIKVE